MNEMLTCVTSSPKHNPKLCLFLPCHERAAEKAEKIGVNKVVLAHLSDGVSGDDLRTVALEIRNNLGAGAVVVLISNNEDKPVLVVACDEAARNSGAKAGELVRTGAKALGGGGGGKDDFAQGGGVDPSAIPKAFKEITKLIEGKFN